MRASSVQGGEDGRAAALLQDSQQAMSRREQWTEGTHRLEEPVSNTTVKG